MVSCPLEHEPNAFHLRVRNDFIEWAPLSVEAEQWPSSSPPTCRIRNTSAQCEHPLSETKQRPLSVLEPPNRPSSSPAAYDMPELSEKLTERKPHSSGLPACSVQHLGRAQPSQSALAGRLPTQALRGIADDKHGLHPSHPQWIGHRKIMLRNLPCRCKAYEIEDFITAGGVSSDQWVLVMPVGSFGRNRGYAFIIASDPGTAMEIVHILWQQPIPTRVSQRPLQLQPAFDVEKSRCCLAR
eukprot:TRINITY_DN7277_c0_g3_i1.p1 TRINITY_DN7277_c0_g3~~TRINITY_DN7277_c0_g3_i1.p1  ORF type:complete len:241 (+),score=22.13 TRINITY_DN7277_c0_g3_i1:58-780(+)